MIYLLYVFSVLFYSNNFFLPLGLEPFWGSFCRVWTLFWRVQWLVIRFSLVIGGWDPFAKSFRANFFEDCHRHDFEPEGRVVRMGGFEVGSVGSCYVLSLPGFLAFKAWLVGALQFGVPKSIYFIFLKRSLPSIFLEATGKKAVQAFEGSQAWTAYYFYWCLHLLPLFVGFSFFWCFRWI